MTKKPRILLLATALALMLTACGGSTAPVEEGDPTAAPTQAQTTDPETPANEPGETGDAGEPTEPETPAGPPVPTFEEPWPAEMLPAGFPDLGKVSRVIDSRNFGGRVTIYWNILTEPEAQALIDQLNPWLDTEMVWQGMAFSDGHKNAEGTEDSILMVRARGPLSAATGQLEPSIDAQFSLEVTGTALPAP